MKNGLPVGLLLVCLGTATVLALSMASVASSMRAQGTEAWEYGYLVDVVRIDVYETSIEGWSASRDDKAFMLAHVFAYETGFSENDRILNKLKRMNELAEEGWALYDDEFGLLRRRR